MRKNCIRGTIAGMAVAMAAFSQTAAAPAAKSFDVASIKPAPPLTPALIASGKFHAGMSVDGARVDIGFFALPDLIRTAYKLKSYQLTGPDWMNAQRFDILAKMPEGATKDDVPEMLQGLLAERFKLTFHRDTKEHSVYALVIAKGGLKLKPASEEPEPPPPPDDGKKGGFVVGSGSSQMRVNPSGDGRGATMSGANGEMKMSMSPNGTMRMEFKKMPMEALIEMVSRFVDRPVMDMTELKGKYEVALDLTMDDLKAMAAKSGMAGMMGMPMGMGMGAGAGAGPADIASDPSSSIYTSLTQMGLKLESRKMPIEILVIDRMEKMPTEN